MIFDTDRIKANMLAQAKPATSKTVPPNTDSAGVLNSPKRSRRHYKSKIDTDEILQTNLMAQNRRNVRQWRSALIKFARLQKNLTQQEIARRLNIFQSSYSSIESNGSQSRHLPQIADILDIPVDLLKNPTINEFKDYIRKVTDQSIRYNLTPNNSNYDAAAVLLVVSPHQIHILLQGLSVLKSRYRNHDRVTAINRLYNEIEKQYQMVAAVS